MTFHPFDADIPHIAYAALGGFVVLFGMFSLFIREKAYIGEACLAFLFGVIVGPYGANIFDPRGWGDGNDDTTNQITLEVTRVILAVGVFAIGVELPKAYMTKHWKSLFFLLCPVMTWGWLVSAGLIFALIPGLDFLSSLAVAACLTPTDPILAAAVVGGKYADKHVPAHLRHLLAAESGCNDGAAFPFLYIALYLVKLNNNGEAVEDWFLITWLYEVILGVVLGSVIGYAFRHLMKFCERKDLIDRQSYVAQYVSLALFTIGVVTMLGSDDLLAAFACGSAFAWDGFFNKQTEQAVFSSVIDLLFNIAAFVFIGAWMPFNSFDNAALTLSVWRLIVIAILVLLLRRLPIMLLIYKWIPDVKTFREAVFSGHFGPMGVGAVFISTLAAEYLEQSSGTSSDQIQLLTQSIQPIVAFMVLCSITIHGLSIPFFSLGRRVHSVSRTWSHHQSMDPSHTPEWALQARRVHRPEDIIINRDNIMERGELTPEEKEHIPQDDRSPSESPEGSSPSETTVEESPSDAVPSVDAAAATITGDIGECPRSDDAVPPDGTETSAEWVEGKDLVIEKRSGPGEEVEVQVIHQGAPEGRQSTETFRGAVHEVEEAVRSHVDKWKHGSHAVDKLLEGTSQKKQVRLVPSTGTTQDIAPEQSETSQGLIFERGSNEDVDSINADAQSEVNVTDDEEGWTSDRSGSRREATTSTVETADEDPESSAQSPGRSKSPKQKHSFKPSVFVQRAGRKRPSIRKALLNRPRFTKAYSSPIPTITTENEDDERGRPLAVERPHIDTANLRPIFTNRRVDSLRSPISRSASPARSVRFAEYPTESGASTPRHPDPDSTPTSSSLSQRVSFHIPSSPR